MKLRILLTSAVLLTTAILHAQTPVVVPAAGNSTVVAAPATAGQTGVTGTAAMLREVQALREQNAETLRKQAATLQMLDDLEKQADQLRIYSRRS